MEAYDEFASIYDFARNCYRLGDYEQACDCYKSALDLKAPRDIHAGSLYWEYSLCLYKNGDCAESLKMIQQGLSYYPDCRELYYIRGEIYYELGLLAHSHVYFTKCISFKVTRAACLSDEYVSDYRAYWYLAAIAAHQGKSEETSQYLRLFVMEKPPFSALQRLCLLLEHLQIETHALINNLRETSGFAALDIDRLLLSIKEHETCLTATNRLDVNGVINNDVDGNLECKGLNRGCFMEAKALIERSPAHEEGSPEHYCILGIAYSRLGIYEQAVEYFLQAMALEPENLIYPCFTFEALAIQATKVLVQKFNSLEENPLLINELLRLCTIKRKSMQLRQTIVDQSDNGDGRGRIYGRFNILSIIDDVSEEDRWNLNV